MAIAKTDPQLGSRLERLTGEEASCCVSGYQALTNQIRKDPGFRAGLLRAQIVADENRYLTLELIRREGALCACEIQAALGVSHATVSHHMHALIRAGLVSAERKGKWVYYRLVQRHGKRADS
jgi:DNA-binding transcriptional ArsR family regulator